MANKMITCKACGKEIATSAKNCPHCGAKNKKPFFKKWWFWLIIAFVFIVMVSGNSEDPVQQTGTISTQSTQATTPTTKAAYNVGDILLAGDLQISYLSCEEYKSDNMFVEPKEGYRFVSCEFEFENQGKNDEFISSWDFDCYADGFSCENTSIRDDDLSATLSAGRKTKGTVTFEVPTDAKKIELEYETNYWTSSHIVFTIK